MTNCFLGFSQVKLDTVYYDANYKAVEMKEFSQTYAIVTIPSDPHYNMRYKQYSTATNTLISEGAFSSWDRYDWMSIVREGTVTSYFDNGNKKSITPFKNNMIDGKYLEYYENGTLKKDVSHKDDMRNGKYLEYYEDGTLRKDLSFKDDMRNGNIKTYYSNGVLANDAQFKNDRLDGVYKRYNQKGQSISETHYRKGVPVGLSFSGSKRTYYKQFIDEDNLNASVCVMVVNAYLDQDIKIKTNSGSSVKFNKGKGNNLSNYIIRRFTFNIDNHLAEDLMCSITNVKVEYIKSGKPSKDMAISAETIGNLIQYWKNLQTKTLLDWAKYNAKKAATTTTTNSASTTSSAYANSSQNVNGNYKANASGYGAAYGANNSGQRAYAASGYTGNYNASGNVTNNYSGNAYGTTNTRTSSAQVDGNLEYQILQNEMAEAEKKIEGVNQEATEVVSQSAVSSFQVKQGDTTTMIISASEYGGSYDTIRLTFDFNGVPHSIEWNNGEFFNDTF